MDSEKKLGGHKLEKALKSTAEDEDEDENDQMVKQVNTRKDGLIRRVVVKYFNESEKNAKMTDRVVRSLERIDDNVDLSKYFNPNDYQVPQLGPSNPKVEQIMAKFPLACYLTDIDIYTKVWFEGDPETSGLFSVSWQLDLKKLNAALERFAANVMARCLLHPQVTEM